MTGGHDVVTAVKQTDNDEEAGIRAALARLTEALSQEQADRGRADCMARVQTDAVQLTLDLLVQEPDIEGFFRVFLATLIDECDSHACGVWLLNDDQTEAQMWMAQIGDRVYTTGGADWSDIALPRDAMSAHLVAFEPGHRTTIDYHGDDARLPEPVRVFQQQNGLDSLIVAPMVLSTRTLGWIALSAANSSDCERQWRAAMSEAIARQATLALHQSRLTERSRVEERRQAVLEERNRIARDIHDTLAQGFGAILMQLQAAQRSAAAGPIHPVIQRSLDTAIDLARTHLIEARRSVSALRPQSAEPEDLQKSLHRIVDLARRATDVPVEFVVDGLPVFPGGVGREIAAIAQEAITNAVRHARARRISVHASSVRALGFRLAVSDDGRGIARERHSEGFGMTSMQERADRIGASLTIVTAPRAGTEVVLAWEPPSFTIPGGVSAS